eukprot:scaffold110495_cov40-Phaeocystis_antarctica.AAC.4
MDMEASGAVVWGTKRPESGIPREPLQAQVGGRLHCNPPHQGGEKHVPRLRADSLELEGDRGDIEQRR